MQEMCIRDRTEVEPRPVPQGKVAMSIRDLYVNMPGEHVNGLSLDVIEGERCV